MNEYEYAQQHTSATFFNSNVPSQHRPLIGGGQRYQKLIEAATDYTYTVIIENGSPSGTIHSPASTAITGYTPEEYAKNPYLWFDMIHPDDRDHVRAHIDRILTEDEVPPFEHRIIHKDGNIRWVKNTVVPCYNDHGQLIEYDALVSDITAAKEAAAQIARVNRAYKTLSLCNRALVRARDEKKFLNKICQILTESGGYAWAGINYARPDGKKSVTLVAECGDDKTSLRQSSSSAAGVKSDGPKITESAIRTGKVVMHNTTFAQEGKKMPGQEVSLIAFPLKAEQESIGALTLRSKEARGFAPHEIKLLSELAADLSFGIMALRTRKKHARAEKVRIADQTRLQAIFDTVQTGIVLIDMESRRIADANSTATQLIGLPRERIIGRRCHQLICPAPKGQCPVLDLGQGFINSQPTLLQAGGTSLPILKSVAEVELNGRSFLLESFLDISARIQGEEEQRKLHAQLRHAQKMEAIGTLAGGIAHDFNNLLHAILGYAGLLERMLPKEGEQHQFTLAITEAGMAAASLVRQILSFSRANVKERQPLQLQHMVKEALKLLRATIPSTIAIREEIEPKCLPVLADSSEIHQIIMNLGTNAYHAMREQGGVLTVRLDSIVVGAEDIDADTPVPAPGDYVRLLVSDTGYGIDEATMSRIFEPYFTTKTKEEGTGLGLAIVHGIMTSYEGAICVRSTPGQGTTFTLFFPVHDDTRCRSKGIQQEVTLEKAQGKALVVDDVKLNVALGEYLLKRLGWEVMGVTDSRDALSLFSADPYRFDLVITDQTMPYLTGLDLSKKLLQIRPDLPIVMATGYSELVDEHKALAAGIRKFLTKPIDRTTLIEAMNEIFPSSP